MKNPTKQISHFDTIPPIMLALAANDRRIEMARRELKVLRPDSKGRITLGVLAEGVSGFSITRDKQHRIILEPYVEIPAREKWLFENEKALRDVREGLQDSAKGKLRDKGSFSRFADDEIE